MSRDVGMLAGAETFSELGRNHLEEQNGPQVRLRWRQDAATYRRKCKIVKS